MLREIKTGIYAVLSNLIYRRKDNASSILKEKTVWKHLVIDIKRTETGGTELRASSVGLLISALELLENFNVFSKLREMYRR